MSSATARALESAKARLDSLDLYPRPVRLRRVRVLHCPLLFRLPWLRRFDGYAAWPLILLRSPPTASSNDLLCHELCHVWQMQHRPIRMPVSYLRTGYDRNPYEAEAREAVRLTARADRQPSAGRSRASWPEQRVTGRRG